jgi:hypothetical protein
MKITIEIDDVSAVKEAFRVARKGIKRGETSGIIYMEMPVISDRPDGGVEFDGDSFADQPVGAWAVS